VGKLAVAVVLIGLFVGVVGSLIFIGVRQRPVLEIPPKPWTEPEPLPPWAQRLRVIGLVSYLVAFVFFLVSALAGGPRLLALVVGALGLSVYLASLLIRLALSLRIALRVRRTRSSQ